jgi:ketosteroid isomerase-like protein
MDALRALFSDDLVWHVPGQSEFAGDYNGVDNVLEYFGKLVGASEGTFSAEPHAILADDEHGIGLHTDTATRGGKNLNAHEVLVFHIKDGKITEGWEFHQDTYVYDAFWK